MDIEPRTPRNNPVTCDRKMSTRNDPEHLRALQWIRSREVTVPSVVHEGEVVYQIKHVPVRGPDNPIKYDRVNGLGYFHIFKYVWLREFLDDRLNIATICKLGSVSREFALYASDEKYAFLRYLRIIFVHKSSQENRSESSELAKYLPRQRRGFFSFSLLHLAGDLHIKSNGFIIQLPISFQKRE